MKLFSIMTKDFVHLGECNQDFVAPALCHIPLWAAGLVTPLVAPASYHMPIEVVSVRVREHPHEERTPPELVSYPRKKIDAKTEVNLGFWRATAISHDRVAVSNKYRGKPRLSKPPKLETAVVSIIIAVCRIAWKRSSRYLWKFKRNRNNKSHYIAWLIKPRFQQIPPQGQICAVRRKLYNPTSLGDCRQLWF